MIKELGLTTALAIGGGALMQECDGGGNSPPSLGSGIINQTTWPQSGILNVWGASGYAVVTVDCSDVGRSVGRPNPPVKVVVESPPVWFEGGGSSLHPGAALRRHCPYAYPYVVRVGGYSWD